MGRDATDSAIAAGTRERTSRFQFESAVEADDAELRRLSRLAPMEGDVQVTLRREPSFFRAAAVEGPDYRVLTARDARSNRIVAMGSVSIRRRYVDGVPESVGYLSALRILPEYRGGTLLARGYRALRTWLDEGPAPDFYLTTIASSNRQSLAALTGRRADLPIYSPVGEYHSLVLPLQSFRPVSRTADLSVRPLAREELPKLVEWLQCVGPRRQFFPCYTEEDFVVRVDAAAHAATFQGLPVDGILTAWRGSELVGTLGLWDQLPFRQTVVERYSPWLACLRPAYNVWARLRRRPQFPRVGRPFRYLTAALPLVSDSDPQVFRALLSAAAAHSRELGHNTLMLGMGTDDPLFPMLRKRASFTYVTNVYAVHWGDRSKAVQPLTERDFYLELGCL